jgi:predicted nucleotidyltransferase
VFGSVARGDAGLGSDLDVLVEMGVGPSPFKQAALQNALEDLLGCRVHLTTASGLRYASDHTREEIEREAVPL